jgi:hypothetical protein
MNRKAGPTTLPDSFKVLDEARRLTEGHNSHTTREALTNAVKAAFNQNSPRDFQLDVAEALILGLDTTVIAGTGKTLPWAMPLLLNENREKACLVISPLKALQVDHVSHHSTQPVPLTVDPQKAGFFSKLGLPAMAVNNDTWNDTEVKHVCWESSQFSLADCYCRM